MKLYRRLIRPMLSSPDPEYGLTTVFLEKDMKWYPEEDAELLRSKYSHLETVFDRVVFESKYEEVKPE